MNLRISRSPGVLVRLVVLATFILASGCARPALEQRTTQGPTAEKMWVARMVSQNGRTPTFDERRYWDEHIDEQISEYLRDHPDVANSTGVSEFRFSRQALVGMTQEQVTILLGPPDAVVKDPAEIEKLARRFAPQIKKHASEAWVYPLGWRLYFAGSELVDITQYLPRSVFDPHTAENSR